MSIWIIVAVACFLVLALSRLDWAVLVIIAALPAYLIRFHILGFPLTLLEVMILIAFAVWFFKSFVPNLKSLLRENGRHLAYPYAWEIILVLILSFVAAGVTGFNAGALGIWKAYFFEPILFFILLFNVFKNRNELPKIFWALLLSAAAISLFAIFQKITGAFIANPAWAAAETRRAVSVFGYPNAVGLYLAPIIMLLTGWLFSLSWENIFDQALKKIVICLTIISSLSAIYYARSEGALIGLAGALFVFGLSAGRKWLVTTLLLSTVVISGIFLYPPIRSFVLTKAALRDLSGEIRRQQWTETTRMLADGRVISGAGLDNYQTMIKPYHQEGIFFNSDNRPNFDAVVWASSTLRTKYWQPVEIYLYPHNIILNFWSELGLFGLLIFIWLIIKYLFGSFRLKRILERAQSPDQYLVLGLATALITMIVHGLVDVPYFKNDLAVMFWLFFALLGLLNLYYARGKKS
ncbi:MAG: O-antigen ligase family protein [Patescibacteria group bacterium]